MLNSPITLGYTSQIQFTFKMDTALGKLFKLTGTANTKATSDAVTMKISKKLGKKPSAKEVDDLMLKTDDHELEKHGN